MNELWKGIAIAGIWIACAAIIVLPAFAARGKGEYTLNGGATLLILALAATIAVSTAN